MPLRLRKIHDAGAGIERRERLAERGAVERGGANRPLTGLDLADRL